MILFIGMLYIGRLLGGFAGGICSVVSPTYVGNPDRIRISANCWVIIIFWLQFFFFCYLGEFATPPLRGALGFAFQLMLVLGILITSIFGLGVDWRLTSAIMAVFPVVFLLSMIYIPESPYHLMKKGMVRKSKLLGIFKFFFVELRNH